MLAILYKTIWNLIMLLFQIYIKIYLSLKSIKLKIINAFYFGGYVSDFSIIKKCHNLDKIPKHLSVILGSEQIDSNILSKIAIYALMSKINYISYYDMKNTFTLDNVNIPKFIYCKKIKNNKFLWSMSMINDGNKNNNTVKETGSAGGQHSVNKNGLEKSIEITILSSENGGKSIVVEVCKELCAAKSKSSSIIQRTSSSEVKEQDFTEKINETYQRKLNHLPDPDIAIVFDKTICTYGFLPWQTGFTEFYNIDTPDYFDATTFSKILHQFSKCEQRFGK